MLSAIAKRASILLFKGTSSCAKRAIDHVSSTHIGRRDAQCTPRCIGRSWICKRSFVNRHVLDGQLRQGLAALSYTTSARRTEEAHNRTKKPTEREPIL